jgi:hypothetical protein
MPAVSGFLPSAQAFRFGNSWPHVPAFTIDVKGLDVPIGDASKGLCGGMVFAARDYFEKGQPIPTVTTTPGSGPLYEHVGRRLKESFDLPLGPAKYLQFMAAPDGDAGVPVLRWFGLLRVRGIAYRTIHDELPKIAADIDANRLSCIGLVCCRGANPMDLGENHQVLAYRYELAADDMRLWVYDPNRPGRDDIYLRLSVGRPTKPTPIEFVNGSKDVRGFFRVAYTPETPPSV